MKKIALCSLLACLGMMGSSFAGTVNEACYPVKGFYFNPVTPLVPTPYCGGKTVSKWVGGYIGAVNGATLGAVTGSIFGPFGAGAGAVALGYEGAKFGARIGKSYGANEYLYFDNEYCLECDKHQVGEDFECPNQTVVTNGAVAYKCNVQGAGDHWTEYKIPVCSDSPVKVAEANKKYKTILRDPVTSNGKTFSEVSGVVVYSASVCMYVTEEGSINPEPGPTPNPKDCPNGEERATKTISGISSCTGAMCKPVVAGQCYDRKFLRCMQAIDGKVEKVVWNNNACICTDDKKEFDYDTRKCVAKSNHKTCEQLYPNGSAERLACCRAGSATKWTGSETSGTCTCVDKTKEWKYSNGVGKCQSKDGGGNEDSTPDTTQECWYQFSADLRCANGAYISQTTGYTLEVKGETCESFKSKFGNDKAFMLAMLNKFCSQQGSTPIIPDDKAFNAAKDSLNAFFNSAKSSASVWKNSEGKFNTTRLASDLTAGVVLGTVGGVVSGVVIKKKQVEKGFDALHCTVGGQKVADWGDEFNIGLRR